MSHLIKTDGAMIFSQNHSKDRGNFIKPRAIFGLCAILAAGHLMLVATFSAWHEDSHALGEDSGSHDCIVCLLASGSLDSMVSTPQLDIGLDKKGELAFHNPEPLAAAQGFWRVALPRPPPARG